MRSDDDEEDETAALMRELEKIKKERAELAEAFTEEKLLAAINDMAMAIGMQAANGTAHVSERPNLFCSASTTGEDGDPNKAIE